MDTSAFLRSHIRTVPDWPAPGVMFRDITPLLQSPQVFRVLIDTFVHRYMDPALKPTVVAGLDARGFIIGSVVAYELGVGFVPIRKKGKLPFTTVEETYELEYGSATVELHTDAVRAGDRVLLIDDLIATGGTMMAGRRLLEKLGAEVTEGASHRRPAGTRRLGQAPGIGPAAVHAGALRRALRNQRPAPGPHSLPYCVSLNSEKPLWASGSGCGLARAGGLHAVRRQRRGLQRLAERLHLIGFQRLHPSGDGLRFGVSRRHGFPARLRGHRGLEGHGPPLVLHRLAPPVHRLHLHAVARTGAVLHPALDLQQVLVGHDVGPAARDRPEPGKASPLESSASTLNS